MKYVGLSEKGLREMMRDRRYRNSSHPEHRGYVGAVKKGYELLYGQGRNESEYPEEENPEDENPEDEDPEDEVPPDENGECPEGYEPVRNPYYIPGTSFGFTYVACRRRNPFPGGGTRG